MLKFYDTLRLSTVLYICTFIIVCSVIHFKISIGKLKNIGLLKKIVVLNNYVNIYKVFYNLKNSKAYIKKNLYILDTLFVVSVISDDNIR